MVANTCCGQLDRKNIISLSLFAPDNLVRRNGFGRPVPRQLNLVLTRFLSFLRLSATVFISIVNHYRVTQLRPNGANRRESAGRGLVVLDQGTVSSNSRSASINIVSTIVYSSTVR